jgi:glycosyltransferase involved in cell wall biosynthesis
VRRGPVVATKLHIALVTPFSWSVPGAVNQHVADLARELRARGHLPVVVVSSDNLGDERRMRALFHRTRGRVVTLLEEYRRSGKADRLLLPTPGAGPLEPEGGVPVLPLGSSLPIRLNGGVASLGLPVDVTSRLEKLLLGARFDIVHVHEPLAPSLSFTALREARSPVVATFHLTPVGVAAYELGQSVLDRFFLRLDGRMVTFPAGRAMIGDLYPGEYQVIPCGTAVDRSLSGPRSATASAETFGLYVYRGDGRRSFRALIRELITAFPETLDSVAVAYHRASVARWVPRTVPRKLRTRLSMFDFETPQELVPFYQAAAVTILPFLGGEWLCATAAESAVCGCPVVGPDLPPVRDLVRPLGVSAEGGRGVFAGNRGAVFLPSESGSLATAVASVLGDPIVRKTDMAAEEYTMPAVASSVERVYEDTIGSTSRRQGLASQTPVAGYSLHVRGIGKEPVGRRMRHGVAGHARPDWINADLHVHSSYSKDCASSVESILSTAREIGLGALAIADHNAIEGAFLARDLAQGDPFVIVAEEVKTAEGEVIGLFLQEAIPPSLSFDHTLSLIKEQGGLVYVPHPFDALRTTPSYRALVDNLHRIDVIEIFNAKVALSSFNLSAERFAAKYNIVAGAGSDAHVLQGLGTAMIRMPRFTDPPSFMAALWEADIIARRKSLLYLQSLKLLQTTLDRVLPED